VNRPRRSSGAGGSYGHGLHRARNSRSSLNTYLFSTAEITWSSSKRSRFMYLNTPEGHTLGLTQPGNSIQRQFDQTDLIEIQNHDQLTANPVQLLPYRVAICVLLNLHFV